MVRAASRPLRGLGKAGELPSEVGGMSDFQDRVLLLTGAAGGIGRAAATAGASTTVPWNRRN